MKRQTQTTIGERVTYHGAVLGDGGQDFIEVDGLTGGYAPLVTLKIAFVGADLSFYLSPEDARELARHLTEAARSANAQG